MEEEIASYYKKFVESVDSEDSTIVNAIPKMADTLEQLTTEKITQLKKITVPKGGEKVLISFQNEFQFVLDRIKYYKLLSKENASVTEKEVAINWTTTADSVAEKIKKEIIDSQIAFGKEKGFKIK
jgi:hypothetical protein